MASVIYATRPNQEGSIILHHIIDDIATGLYIYSIPDGSLVDISSTNELKTVSLDMVKNGGANTKLVGTLKVGLKINRDIILAIANAYARTLSSQDALNVFFTI